MGISVDKCCVMTFGKRKIDQFHILDAPLPIVSFCRDLGIIISNDLFPSAHINDIVFIAHKKSQLDPVLFCLT